MRIAIICPYALSTFGGVQEQALAMSRELIKRDHEVIVIAPDSKDANIHDTKAIIKRFGSLISVPANGSKAQISFSLFAMLYAHKALKYFKPDVIHYHEPFTPLIGWKALMAHDVPTVATFHRNGSGPALTLTRPLLRYFASKIDISIAVSASAQKTTLRACGINADIFFNGLEAKRFVEIARSRTSETLLITIGRLEARKGVACAIEAVKIHNKKNEDQWKLVVIGDGPQLKQLKKMSGNDSQIVFTGSLNDLEKRLWLRTANALIAPSLYGESFGLILLEGMASETIVIASDIDGYREACAGYAALFPPGDTAQLEKTIAKALYYETTESIATAKKHSDKWSIASLMDKYEAMYALAINRFQNIKLAKDS